MRILVTGGRGTVGSVLVRDLRGRGHDVFVCDHAHGPDEVGYSLRTDVKAATYARCNVAEFRQVARVFEKHGPFDIVYHLAAEFGRWNGEDFYEHLWAANAVGTKNLIRLQEELRFKLVHFSSSEVYGDWEGVMSEDVLENHEIKQMNDYALSKWVNECQIRNSRIQYGTESVVVRLFNTYGPGEHYSPYRSVNCRFLYCAMVGLPFVVHKGHFRTSTYVDDTVRTLANISNNFKPGETYNISSDQYHSIEELADHCLRLTGRPASLGEYKDPEILTTKIKKVDNSKSVRDLDHKNTVALGDGLRRTLDWMKLVYREDGSAVGR